MTDSPAILTMPEECGLTWVVSAHEQIAPQVAAGTFPRIDISAIRRITTPAIQLVLALARDAHASGHPIEIAGVSRPFDEAIANLALTAQFEKWSRRTHG